MSNATSPIDLDNSESTKTTFSFASDSSDKSPEDSLVEKIIDLIKRGFIEAIEECVKLEMKFNIEYLNIACMYRRPNIVKLLIKTYPEQCDRIVEFNHIHKTGFTCQNLIDEKYNFTPSDFEYATKTGLESWLTLMIEHSEITWEIYASICIYATKQTFNKHPKFAQIDPKKDKSHSGFMAMKTHSGVKYMCEKYTEYQVDTLGVRYVFRNMSGFQYKLVLTSSSDYSKEFVKNVRF